MREGELKPGEIVPGTRYRVVGLIGSGGMGLVYDVEHLELGKRFVLKALLSDLAGRDDIAARLRNEQRALGRLQHPNIVTVTDAGVTATKIPFFVMERLEGETLGARLKRRGRLPVVEAMAIARGVLEGLSAAHEIGVVHRDVKPQNIFLCGAQPKILDFGVAKIADAGSVITARGVAIGTPRYMSPEQVGGERVDGRSDLYAVGLLLFESITGKGPFDDARDSNEMLLAHLGKTAPRLVGKASGVTRELDELVSSLLAKSPGDRPPSARAAVAGLERVASRYGGGSNLEAPTPPVAYSSTAHRMVLPTDPAGALPTRPDGVAARGRAPGSGVSGTTERLLDGTAARTTTDEPRGPGGTLYDPSSRMLTVAQPNPVIPIDAVRTERLDIVGVSRSDEPTHTRVPVTPSDGTPSLVPVRVDGPRSQRRAPTRAVIGAAFVALVVGSYVALRVGTASVAGGMAAEHAGARALSQPASVSVAAPSAISAGELPSASAPMAAREAHVAISAPSVAPAASGVSHARARPSAVLAASSAPSAPRPPSAKSAGSSIPLGLPGSGL
jgi:serine/threonine-protein kinase